MDRAEKYFGDIIDVEEAMAKAAAESLGRTATEEEINDVVAEIIEEYRIDCMRV